VTLLRAVARKHSPRSTSGNSTGRPEPRANYEAFFGQATTLLFSITQSLEPPG
jgi:hypothetical protein